MLKGSEAQSNEESYDAFPRIEEAFQQELDKSLDPRGPDVLFDIVREFGMKPGANVIDVGCGEGEHAIDLAKRFKFNVLGIDPLPRHIELSTKAAKGVQGVSFKIGAADNISTDDGTVDLIWSREVIGHVEDLEGAFKEFRRVLSTSGKAMVEATFAGENINLSSVDWPWRVKADEVQDVKKAVEGAGLKIEKFIDLAGEWGEFSQEKRREPGRRLVHIARMLRQPDRYIRKFGEANYKIMLADCFWHVYRMTGVLRTVVFVLKQD